MGVYNSTGNRMTKAGLNTSAWVDPDPKVTVNDTYYESFDYKNTPDMTDNQEGIGRRIAFVAGEVVRTSAITALYPAATVDTITPATGTTAGGTVVSLKGSNLDGVTSVTFGGTAGTALTIVSQVEVRVTTPAKTAAAYNVVIADDSGTVTKTAAFTFA